MVRLDAEVFAHRILRRLPQFRRYEESEIRRRLRLGDDERLIGVYENTPGALERAVVVTTKSLVFLELGGALRVNFEDIEAATWSPESKREADTLRVTLQNRSICRVPITGKTGGGSDVFEFVRFVSRCTAVARGDHPAMKRRNDV